MNGFNCRATTKISLIIPGFSDSLTASQSRGVMYIVLYLLMSMVQDLLQWPSNRANDNMATESKQGSGSSPRYLGRCICKAASESHKPPDQTTSEREPEAKRINDITMPTLHF